MNKSTKPSYGSLFTGVGGLDLGVERGGFGDCKWQVEIDDYCTRVLAKQWPNVTRYRDVRECEGLVGVDCVIGGFPYQDVSSAGKGKGLVRGARSGLWREFARILGEVKPTWAIVENVTSGAKRWLPFVRRDLHLLGYRTRAVGISAFECGAPHLRQRVFVLAADPHRALLRNEQRWNGGPGQIAEGAAKPRHDGKAGTPCNIDRTRQLQLQRPVQSEWRWSRNGAGKWQAESPVSGVAHGLSYRLDLGAERQRVLGNAVVPICGETAARMLLAEAPLLI